MPFDKEELRKNAKKFLGVCGLVPRRPDKSPIFSKGNLENEVITTPEGIDAAIDNGATGFSAVLGHKQKASAFVVDCDAPKKEGEPNGLQTFFEFCKKYGMPADTWTVKTPGGGLQVWLKAGPGLPKNIGPKVDILGGPNPTGFAAVPGSLGAGGKVYEWVPGRSPDDVPLSDAPDKFHSFGENNRTNKEIAAEMPTSDEVAMRQIGRALLATIASVVPEGKRRSTAKELAKACQIAGVSRDGCMKLMDGVRWAGNWPKHKWKSLVNWQYDHPLKPKAMSSDEAANVGHVLDIVSPHVDLKWSEQRGEWLAPSESGIYLKCPETHVPHVFSDGIGRWFSIQKTFFDGAEVGTPESFGLKNARKVQKEHASTRGVMPFIAMAKGSPSYSFDSLAAPTEHMIAVKNGLIDPITCEFRELRDDDYVADCMDVEFDPNATCPMWMDFIQRAQPENHRYMQKAAGITALNENALQVVFFLRGVGGSGKSTFAWVLNRLFGGYGHSMPNKVLDGKLEAHTSSIASLSGKRMVFVDEVNHGKVNSELLKTLTGSPTLTIRPLYGHERTIKLAATFWLTGNRAPHVSADDTGYFRRVKIIHFDRVPESVDPYLPQKLLKEGPGILNWILDGLRAYRAEGLHDTDSIRSQTEVYRVKGDRVGEFMAEHEIRITDMRPNDTVRLGELEIYEKYKNWSMDRGFEPQNLSNFRDSLRIACPALFEPKERHFRTRVGSGKGYVFLGCSWESRDV